MWGWNRLVDRAEIDGKRLRVSVTVREDSMEWSLKEREPLEASVLEELRSVRVDSGRIMTGGSATNMADRADVDRQLAEELRDARSRRDYLGAYLAVINHIAFCIERERRDPLDVRKMLALEAALNAINVIKHDLVDGSLIESASSANEAVVGMMRDLAQAAT